MSGYTGPQVCRLAGITYRQLDHWCRIGLLEPWFVSKDGGPTSFTGSGTSRRFDAAEVVVACALGSLSRLGQIDTRRVASAVPLIRAGRGRWLVIDNRGATVTDDLHLEGTTATVVDLAAFAAVAA